MRIAVVGSRAITDVDIGAYLEECDEFVSGGAKGVDACAAAYANRHNIPLTEFLPDYKRYGRAAPLIRNREIVAYADKVLVFWDGHSKGAQWVIRYAERAGKACQVIRCR